MRFLMFFILFLIWSLQFLIYYQFSQFLMKPIRKTFTTISLENLIGTYKGLKIEQQILDKPRKVTDYHYCMSQPKKRNQPHLAGLSKRVLNILGLDQQETLADQYTPLYLSGNKLIPGSVPLSHNYCGHQFGVWAGQLGDGRAHTLGHLRNEAKAFELQLKGSGLSPFSRHADGNSVVSSAVREFLVSELMAGLGVPTTRALSLVIAKQDVIRDPFYNGIIKIQNAAIVLRVAQSFIRFGSFQVCNPEAQMHKQSHIQNRKLISSLADYLIKNFYPNLDQEEGDIYEQLFKTIVIKTAELVSYWQCIGFVHGVLNTDNMSMINVTIDYGPFGFIDYFSKDYVSNATDQHERYSYRRQPEVVKWNLRKLAQAFDILVPVNVLNKIIEEHYTQTYQKCYYQKMSKKLGVEDCKESREIIDQLFEVMHTCGSNFTNTFRKIAEDKKTQDKISSLLIESLPSDYFKRSLRLINNPNIPQEQINLIRQSDPGFNIQFLTEQPRRRAMMQQLLTQSCQQRTAREKKLWQRWLQKYENLKPNRESQEKNTIKYVLLNQTAKSITEQLNQLKEEQQRKLLNQILQVFANPYQYNEWFEKKYWSKRPVPVRLTCSS